MEPIDRRMMLGAAGLAGVAAMTKLAGAGPLNPPAGPVGPTGQTLDDIYNRIARTDVGVAEPRIPVQSLPGSATALHVISEPGSYYLTGNIVGEAGKNGIEIRESNVSLDLRGFAVIGVPGSLEGVVTLPMQQWQDVLVENGSVIRWGVNQVQIRGNRNSARRLSVGEGGGIGIELITGTCTECVATHCNTGFITNGVVENCIARFCVGGFGLREGAVARGCYVGGTTFGFDTTFGASVLDSVANQCNVGAILRNSALVARCGFERCSFGVGNNPGEYGGLVIDSLFENCATAVSLAGAGGVARNCEIRRPRIVGVQLGDEGRASDCHVSGEASDADPNLAAFILGNTSVLENCTSVGVRRGVSAIGTGNFVRACSVSGAVTAYTIAPGNARGPIVNVAGVGDISSVPGANHPWANFIY